MKNAYKASALNTKKKKKSKFEKKMRMATASMRARAESLVWTVSEVKLLLHVMLKHNSSKLQETVDWESCQSKYTDIMDVCQEQYPRDSAERDFPHDAES